MEKDEGIKHNLISNMKSFETYVTQIETFYSIYMNMAEYFNK